LNKLKLKISGIDIFAGTNTLLFLYMCNVVYFDRFIYFRGHAYLWEFFVYAVIILAVIAAAWRIIRHVKVSAWILLLVQIGIVLHFSGGLAIWHESRLYDKIIFNIRYDKYVHFFNSFIGGLIFYSVYFKNLNLNRWIKEFQMVLVIQGLGSIVEIVEYLVTLTVATNGVGGYDNNMLDIIANLAGSLFSVFMIRMISIRKE
jgi:hypothetical protein